MIRKEVILKGSVWQKKISSFGDGCTVIPYNFYGDGVQLNNPLGTHIRGGLQNFNYISFPTIPTEYQSRLNNIMVASSYQGICIFFNRYQSPIISARVLAASKKFLRHSIFACVRRVL